MERMLEEEPAYVRLFGVIKDFQSDSHEDLVRGLAEGPKVPSEREIIQRAREDLAVACAASGEAPATIPSELWSDQALRFVSSSMRPADTMTELKREYVHDNHGTVVEQFRRMPRRAPSRGLEVHISVDGFLDYVSNRILLMDDLRALFGRREKCAGRHLLDRHLVKEALRNRAISIDSIPQKPLREFLHFCKAHDLRRTVVIGGAVRDIFFGAPLADIDTASTLPLRESDRLDLRRFIYPEDSAIYEESQHELSKLASALGIQKENFLGAHQNPAPSFSGLPLTFVGPMRTTTLGTGIPTHLVRILFDQDSGEELSFNSGLGALKLGIDCEGRLYGRVDCLKDLLLGRTSLHGSGFNFRIGEVLRFLRLKYEFGLEIDALSYAVIHWRLSQYEKRRLPLPKVILFDVRQQIDKILGCAADRAAARREMEDLGIFNIVERAERGELELPGLRVVSSRSDSSPQPQAYERFVNFLSARPEAKTEARLARISEVSLHLNQYCNLNCRHCGADAKPPPPHQTGREILSWDHTRRAAEYLNSAHVEQLLIAGGGEPTLELEKILHLARNGRFPNLVIVSNGWFGSDRNKARKVLTELRRASRTRPIEAPLAINVCLSVDSFHQEQLPLEAIINILESEMDLRQSRKDKPISLSFNTLHGFDQPIARLAAHYGTEWQSPVAPLREPIILPLPDGSSLPVTYSRYMTKSVKAKEAAGEVPPEFLSRDEFPTHERSPYRVGGTLHDLQLRIYENGQIVAGREGRGTLVLGNLSDPGISIERTKLLTMTDPILRALREWGLERVVSEASAIDSGIAAEISAAIEQHEPFIVEKILALLTRDQSLKLELGKRILNAWRNPASVDA